MRKWKVAAAATAASGALAIGMFAAFTLTAKAGTVTAEGCSTSYTGTVAETTALTCTATDSATDGTAIAYPLQVTLTATTSTSTATGDAGLPVTFVWSSVCTEQSGNIEDGGATTTPAVVGDESSLTLQPETSSSTTSLNAIDPTTCNLTVKVTVSGDDALTATGLQLTVLDDESSLASTSPTASPSASTSTASTTTYYNNQVHGFDGTCLDDKGNSSAERTEVIIWQCNNTDQAQGWTYSGDELKIHGVCVNAKGNGKTGSKLILWKCTGSANEIFVHRSNGEFAEKANGYSVCIDDPAYKTKNGTQLFVYKCNNGANQHFTKP
jgi:Ricin-type beta-trefoil lectin domain